MPDMPRWAHVWFWLRFLREPQNMTPLPQQGIHPEAMSLDSYDLYEAEWEDSGAPSTSPEKVLIAMGAEIIPDDDDDEIPF